MTFQVGDRLEFLGTERLVTSQYQVGSVFEVEAVDDGCIWFLLPNGRRHHWTTDKTSPLWTEFKKVGKDRKGYSKWIYEVEHE